MCGTKFHMLSKLLTAINARKPYLSRIPKITDKTFVFMIAKQECKYSKKALSILKDDLKISPDNISIVEKDERLFLCAKTWQLISKKPVASEENVNLQQILGLLDLYYKNKTVPQIFIHSHPTWYYIGGCMDLINLMSSSTVEDTQGDDLLHLLPLVKGAQHTSPIQLRF